MDNAGRSRSRWTIGAMLTAMSIRKQGGVSNATPFHVQRRSRFLRSLEESARSGDLQYQAAALPDRISASRAGLAQPPGRRPEVHAHSAAARIEAGSFARDAEAVNFVRGHGVGFDMEFADTLFGVFQRLYRRQAAVPVAGRRGDRCRSGPGAADLPPPRLPGLGRGITRPKRQLLLHLRE